MTEARKLEIPIIGTGDTNVDPDDLDFIIPANDDAIRAIRLLCGLVADAALEGARERSARSAVEAEPEIVVEAEEIEAPAEDARRRARRRRRRSRSSPMPTRTSSSRPAPRRRHPAEEAPAEPA